jgi:pyruvate dehydrogenase E2 component (dihydrolipoamide acetyltransferase)
MPSLGADMQAGTLVAWHVQPGHTVKRGDIVADVETEKGLIEVEIFEAGVVDALLVREGEKVPVGTLLATLRAAPAPGAPAAVARAPAAPATRPEAVPPVPVPAAAVAVPRVTVPPPAAAARRVRVSPLARRLAAARGVDLATVTGTGAGGAVTKADVERAAAAAAPAPPVPAVVVPPLAPATAAPPPRRAAEALAPMRRAIAAAMARSKREIPHYYLATDVDMSRALAWLEKENARRPVTSRLLYSVMLLRAVARAIPEAPEMNGFWLDGAFRPGPGIHVGMAIALRGGGLVAPALHDVDRKSLDELMAGMLDLVKRTRKGVLRSSEVADATITVTSLGEQGVESLFGVIYPPQVALVGFGRIRERPWAQQGMVGARPLMAATLSADHRASDGHRGARFLSAIARALQEPEKL